MSNNLENMQHAEIAIRMATPADEPALQRLAELDSAAAIDGPALIACADRIPVAAYALEEGRSIADPFRHTAAIVELLEARAANLRRAGGVSAATATLRRDGFAGV